MDIMQLELHGAENAYYVQMLCMLLFPGENFHDAALPHVCLSVSEESGVCHAVLSVDDGVRTVRVQSRQQTGQGAFSAEKLCVGYAFMQASEQLFAERPAYGILTGVRPGKLALCALAQGKTPEQTRQMFCKEYLVRPEKAKLVCEVASFEQTVLQSMPKNSCSLYLSVPFCPSRCSYCSFVSFATEGLLRQIPAYLDKLCDEIRQTTALIRSLGLSLTTVYIGGGTPTTLNEAQLKRLLDTVCENADVGALREFTLEAGRPDTITAEKLAIAKEHGVCRISINPQTLNDEILRSVGRRHTVEQFYSAYEAARKSGIPIINTDLIAGLPGESAESFFRSVDEIMRLAPENFTVHTFCVKRAADLRHTEQSHFSRSAGRVGEMVEYARARAAEHGYAPYYLYRQKNTVGNLENVGYAKPGTQSLYNVYMMEEFHSVFGCGAGAVTRLVGNDPSKILRIFSAKYPYEYLCENKSAMSAENTAKIRAFFAEEPK